MENLDSKQKEINTDWVITLVLWFFLGVLGVHRYFNGKIGTGILMLITFGGFGIWWLIDGIVILLGKFTNAENKFVSVKK